MFKFLVLLSFLGLAACQTAQQKNLKFLGDRVEKLKPLSSWRSSQCAVSVGLTEPAKARFKELFPEETDQIAREDWAYTWSARETTCDIRPVDIGPAVKSQKEFLDTAFCLLLQVHYVNSPFDDLKVEPNDVVGVKRLTTAGGDGATYRDEEVVHIVSGNDKDLGIYLPRDRMVVETRTRSHGLLVAEYGDLEGRWLPIHLEQRRGNLIFELEDFKYAETVKNRRMLDSFWIKLSGEKSFLQSKVNIKNCRDL
jgi:hypothetical protein